MLLSACSEPVYRVMASPDAWFACQGDIHYQDTDLTEYGIGSSDATQRMQMVCTPFLTNLSIIGKENPIVRINYNLAGFMFNY